MRSVAVCRCYRPMGKSQLYRLEIEVTMRRQPVTRVKSPMLPTVSDYMVLERRTPHARATAIKVSVGRALASSSEMISQTVIAQIAVARAKRDDEVVVGIFRKRCGRLKRKAIRSL